jgi:hypothetical protein
MKHVQPATTSNSQSKVRALAVGIAALLATAVCSADSNALAPKKGVIGYVLTDLYWAIYQSANAKEECPKGFNDGPREQYEVLFPGNGKGQTLTNSQLKLEAQTWLPTATPDSFPFKEATGRLSYGLDLDGKSGPEDFTHPDGGAGVDNQLFRALGCIIGFRGPDGVEYIFENKAISQDAYNRTMIEVSGVDDLNNDKDVDVTIYRGLDRLLTDATGNKIVPGGSQRIDTRWGKKLIQQVHGRIANGVLTTDPTPQMIIPWMNLGVPTFQLLHDMRLQLKVTPVGAEGVIGGYADVDTWYKQLIRNDSTHHLSNGQISGISLYKAIRRLADAYPDPKGGGNTAISSALNAKFTQVFIQHPDGEAAKTQLVRSLQKGSPKPNAEQATNVTAR